MSSVVAPSSPSRPFAVAVAGAFACSSGAAPPSPLVLPPRTLDAAGLLNRSPPLPREFTSYGRREGRREPLAIIRRT